MGIIRLESSGSDCPMGMSFLGKGVNPSYNAGIKVMHVVAQGECLVGIAKQYGFTNWRIIYDHSENENFRRIRPNPNIIHPGDRIFIPTNEPKSLSAATEKRHQFQRKLDEVRLRILVRDENGSPFSDTAYQLVEGSNVHEGHTDSDGLVDVAISEETEQAKLILSVEGFDDDGAKGAVWDLLIGHLDPEDAIAGVQARLTNLGFSCGPIDGISGPMTERGVSRFQKRNGLRVSGVVDDEVRTQLLAFHDKGQSPGPSPESSNE